MLFNSIEFLIFFPFVVSVYFLLPFRTRWFWLLMASCYFYMAFTPHYIIFLLAVAIVDYIMAILIEQRRKSGKGKGKIFVIIGIVFPLAILFIFKYFDFANRTIVDLASLFNLKYDPYILNLILPVGISFYTFQSLSYVIEVYRGKQKAERHFGMYTLFVTFYPQLVAGPIERPQNLLHQFYKKHDFDYKRITNGLLLMGWGFYKKLVVADRLAFVVNEIYNNPFSYKTNGLYFIVATIFFAIQIYCDFSGYSDIAIGAAQVMGFKLMTNFKRPFLALNTSELWKRWHISMITWFRDYVYIPMGGNRVSYWRWQYNILVMFVLSGVWHGAKWTFVMWATLNAIYLLIDIWTGRLREKLYKVVGLTKIPRIHKIARTFITFFLFCFAAIFFRANSIKEAFFIISHLFTGLGKLIAALFTFNYDIIKKVLFVPNKITIFGFTKPEFIPEMALCILSIVVLFTIENIQERIGSIRERLAQKPWYIRWALYGLLVYTILFLGMFTQQQFIYFRF